MTIGTFLYTQRSKTSSNPFTCFLLSLEELGFVRKLHSTKHSCLLHTVGGPPSSSQLTCKSRCRSSRMKQHRCCLLEPSTHNLQQCCYHQSFVPHPGFIAFTPRTEWYFIPHSAILYFRVQKDRQNDTHTHTHTPHRPAGVEVGCCQTVGITKPPRVAFMSMVKSFPFSFLLLTQTRLEHYNSNLRSPPLHPENPLHQQPRPSLGGCLRRLSMTKKIFS